MSVTTTTTADGGMSGTQLAPPLAAALASVPSLRSAARRAATATGLRGSAALSVYERRVFPPIPATNQQWMMQSVGASVGRGLADSPFLHQVWLSTDATKLVSDAFWYVVYGLFSATRGALRHHVHRRMARSWARLLENVGSAVIGSLKSAALSAVTDGLARCLYASLIAQPGADISAAERIAEAQEYGDLQRFCLASAYDWTAGTLPPDEEAWRTWPALEKDVPPVLRRPGSPTNASSSGDRPATARRRVRDAQLRALCREMEVPGFANDPSKRAVAGDLGLPRHADPDGGGDDDLDSSHGGSSRPASAASTAASVGSRAGGQSRSRDYGLKRHKGGSSRSASASSTGYVRRCRSQYALTGSGLIAQLLADKGMKSHQSLVTLTTTLVDGKAEESAGVIRVGPRRFVSPARSGALAVVERTAVLDLLDAHREGTRDLVATTADAKSHLQDALDGVSLSEAKLLARSDEVRRFGSATLRGYQVRMAGSALSGSGGRIMKNSKVNLLHLGRPPTPLGARTRLRPSVQ